MGFTTFKLDKKRHPDPLWIRQIPYARIDHVLPWQCPALVAFTSGLTSACTPAGAAGAAGAGRGGVAGARAARARRRAAAAA